MEEEKGSVNDRQEACVFVQFSNKAKVEFLIDTGFDCHLCLPRNAMEKLNLRATTSAFIYGVGTHSEALK